MLHFDENTIALTDEGLMRVDQLLPDLYQTQYRNARLYLTDVTYPYAASPGVIPAQVGIHVQFSRKRAFLRLAVR